MGLSLSHILMLVIGIEYAVRGTFMRRRDVWICILPATAGAAVGTVMYFLIAERSELLASAVLLICSAGLTISIQSVLGIPSVWSHATHQALNRYRRWTSKPSLIKEGTAEC